MVRWLWEEWRKGFWKMWPHRFDPYRGSAFCGRCVVHWSLHRGAGRQS